MARKPDRCLAALLLASCTGAGAEVIVHNASDLQAMLRVVANGRTQYSTCLSKGAASHALSDDGFHVTVQDCGNQFRFTPLQPLPPGTGKVYFKTAFELGEIKPSSMNTAVTLTNGMGSFVEYVVTTGPTITPAKTLGQRCVEPGKSDTVALRSAGSVKVSAYIVQTCGSTLRIPYGPSVVYNALAGTAQEVGVRGWLDARP